MHRAASFLCFLAILLPLHAQGEATEGTALAGAWSGSLDIRGSALPLVFHLVCAGGGLSATMDSPSQGAMGIPCSSVDYGDGRLTIGLEALQGGFSGRVSANGTTATGNWTQGSASLPLTLILGKEAARNPRPQTPMPPYPYRSLDFRIPGGQEGIVLGATLFMPAGQGPFPAVVLVTGSGPQDRDETILGHRPFLVIADYLARRGIAVLRYDDRGVAASSGDFARATTFDFALDAKAALSFLAERADIDAGRLGMVGHSEGGLIAPIAASGNPALKFIVLLAGPGLMGSDLLLLQTMALARASGVPEDVLSRAVQVNSRLYAIAASPGEASVTGEAVKRTYLEWTDREAALSPAEREKAKWKADALSASLVSPWMRCFLTLDPGPWLRSLRVPVLALGGSRDLQVPLEENFAALAKAVATDGPASFLTLVRLEGLNHLFQHAATGLPSEYGGIEETFAPEALKAMADWILGR